MRSYHVALFLAIFIVGFFVVAPVDHVAAAAYDIEDITYSGTSTSTAPATSPAGMWVNTDGTRLYISNFSNQTIYQFSMSSGWDISTLSYENKSYSVSSQGSPDDVAFSADGTKMFMLSFYDRVVYQYTLSSAWDVSTASYDSQSLSLGSANHYDFHVKRDGTKLFSANDYQNRIQQYTISSAWDLSGTTQGTNYSYPSLSDGQELVFTMSDNGENMYIGTSGNERIHWFTLSTPWDTSTASYSSTYTSISAQDSSIRKVVLNPTGTIMLAVGQANDKIYEYSFLDETNPTVSTVFPVDNATSVSTTADLSITFDEAVDAESGNITIYKTSDDSVVETIDVTSGNVTGSGGTGITINPTSALAEQTEFYVMIDATAFDDAAGNSYAGITASTTWSFTTADETDPTISTYLPADDATSVGISSNFVLTFSEAVDTETGNIVLYKASDDSVVETIDVTGAAVTGSGTTEITVNPSADLDYATAYYVQIDATAFDDGNSRSFAGITDTTTWSFTSEPTPTCATVNNAATYNSYPTCGVATCNDGFQLSGGQCIAISSAAPPAPAPAVGSGSTDAYIPMGQSDSVGSVGSEGVNIMTFVDSSASFFVPVSNQRVQDQHTLHVLELDLFELTATIQIFSDPVTLQLALGESVTVDLNNDRIDDVEVVFEDLHVNRVEFTVMSLLDSPTTDSGSFTDGQLFKVVGEPRVYRLENNKRRWITDEKTFYALGYQWSNVVELSSDPLFADGEPIADGSSNTVPLDFVFARDLDIGSNGEDVRLLQEFLNSHGFTVSKRGNGSVGNESTYFGARTRKALALFQRSHKVPAYGYFGEVTRAIVNTSLSVTIE